MKLPFSKTNTVSYKKIPPKHFIQDNGITAVSVLKDKAPF